GDVCELRPKRSTRRGVAPARGHHVHVERTPDVADHNAATRRLRQLDREWDPRQAHRVSADRGWSSAANATAAASLWSFCHGGHSAYPALWIASEISIPAGSMPRGGTPMCVAASMTPRSNRSPSAA